MPPISFSDAQLDQAFAGAAPLPVTDHTAYLQAVADLLLGVAEPGDGARYARSAISMSSM